MNECHDRATILLGMINTSAAINDALESGDLGAAQGMLTESIAYAETQSQLATPTPDVNRELLDVAVALWQALDQLIALDEDIDGRDRDVTGVTNQDYHDVLISGQSALADATPLLVELGGIEAEPPDAPEFRDRYDGFGPMGPANADITNGVDPDLYAHPPTCNCPSCDPPEPDGPDPAQEEPHA